MEMDAVPSLASVMKKAQKEHGPNSFRIASDTHGSGILPRIPIGIFSLDFATGGGIPIGRTSMIYGKKSSGKSSLLAKIVANAQKMCRKCYGPIVFEEKEVSFKGVDRDPATGKVVEVKKTKKKLIPVDCANKCRVSTDEDGKKKEFPGRMSVVWIDAEGTFDLPFYTHMGVDCDVLYLIITDYGEQAVELADTAIRTGEVDILITDTIAHFVPKKEREVSLEENAQPGTQARLINRAMRMWTASLNELAAKGHSDCTILLVNQLRQKLGLFPTFTRPGGMGQEFATSLDIQLWQKEFKFDTSGRPLWMEAEFVVEKNKTAPPKMSGKYRMCLTGHPGRNPGDTWDDEAVFEAAEGNGFIEKAKGGVLTVLGKQFADEEKLKAEIHKRGEFYLTLRSSLLDLLIGRPSDGQLAEKKKKDD